ncbi:hypothetical protein [Actinokineospora sp. NBRC 105648]|nr:hypothetical protein [Actinokineospora sp. NBRC 105648]GLZ43514.1 hypothetical protein Acsp05_71380 [Actinokineospora sp. NBRC 105648]
MPSTTKPRPPAPTTDDEPTGACLCTGVVGRRMEHLSGQPGCDDEQTAGR